MCGWCVRGYSLHEAHVLINTKTETSIPSLQPADTLSSILKTGEQNEASSSDQKGRMPPPLLMSPPAYTMIREANILNGLHARFCNK